MIVLFGNGKCYQKVWLLWILFFHSNKLMHFSSLPRKFKCKSQVIKFKKILLMCNRFLSFFSFFITWYYSILKYNFIGISALRFCLKFSILKLSSNIFKIMWFLHKQIHSSYIKKVLSLELIILSTNTQVLASAHFSLPGSCPRSHHESMLSVMLSRHLCDPLKICHIFVYI
jgi:hypothetical protein